MSEHLLFISLHVYSILGKIFVGLLIWLVLFYKKKENGYGNERRYTG